METRIRNRLIAGGAALAVAAGLVAAAVWPRQQPAPRAVNIADYLTRFTYTAGGTDYDAYLAQHAALPPIGREITLREAVTIREGESHSFTVTAPACLASIALTYRVLSANDGDGAYGLTLNGEQPFREAASFPLGRQWTAAAPQADERGNQYAVPLSEAADWYTASAADPTGYHTAPLRFALREGANTLTLTARQGDIAVQAVRFYSHEAPAGYATVKAAYPTVTQRAEPLLVEAEMPARRSDASIAELCDRASPATSPAFGGLQVWNALGGSGWSQIGQSVTWTVHVAHTGLYALSFRYKQNFSSGMVACRRLLIDGALPFAEAAELTFPYASDWRTLQPADAAGTPYLFYLEAGDHTLTLEVTLGALSQALGLAQKSLYELNAIYRKVLMLTGSNPDKYRDYQVAKKLPQTLTAMANQREVLQALSDWLYAGSGSKGEDTAAIDKLIWQLDEFARYPESIPAALSTFQSNITSFSTWLQNRSNQPLTLDYFELLPAGAAPRQANASFWRGLTFQTAQFFRSFATDYGVIGNVYDDREALDVWITLGRDQYQIIKEHIDSTFVPRSGTRANLKLVSGGILEAIVAGIAPDVYLFAGAGDPVNFASRGALLDLSRFPDYPQVAARFAPEALVPYSYDGGVYALPITQSFLVMFTRDDLLAEIGLTAPETWDDVYNMLTILQQNHMEFAFPIPTNGDVSSYALLLFQQQAHLYRDGGRAVAIDSEAAIDAFSRWTTLYRDYSSLLSYNFVNRFRSGDMPVGIVDFSTFNTLEVSAPEIKGLWSMHPVPGTPQADGTVKHVSVSGGTGAILMKDTDLPEAGWAFLKWWTGAEEQLAYAAAIENRQGSSARFATANREAFARLPWTADTLAVLERQRESALGIEQVPGGYFLPRHIDNIFRAVINQHADVRDTVLRYTDVINAEITKKRREFGLEVTAE